jgi:hypothetical protein
MNRIFTSLCHSMDGKFHAVVADGDALKHWSRPAGDRDREWSGWGTFGSGLAGPGALVESSFQSGGRRDLDVAVPLRRLGRIELRHFYCAGSELDGANETWRDVGMMVQDPAGPASLIQSTFGTRTHKNFELVVPLARPHGPELWHFAQEIRIGRLGPWHAVGKVAEAVAGPGCIIQSSFGTKEGHGNFEVVVPVHVEGRVDLWHFYRDNGAPQPRWAPVRMVARDVAGPGGLIQSDFGKSEYGDLEVIVPVHTPRGVEVRHFRHDSSAPASDWQLGPLVSDSVRGWVSLCRTGIGGEHKSFEALVEECGPTVAAYRKPSWSYSILGITIEAPWLRDKVVVRRTQVARLGARKIVQLTGEWDRERWVPAHNQTETRFGIRGTDLGMSFEHEERLYFLFGDTWRVNQSADDTNLDAIACSEDHDPSDGLDLNFLPEPPRIKPCPDGSKVDQGAFNVPLDGVSYERKMYVFFSTNHITLEDRLELMGRSVLTRFDNCDRRFQPLTVFSATKFVNVSIEKGALTAAQADCVGLEPGTGVLWIWGSGRYRSSAVYLSVMPLEGLETRLEGRLFWDGRGWSTDEDDAAPVFCAGSVGELSVRYNRVLRRYLCMFNSDSPAGIVMHSAPEPWGPWSLRPLLVFDPWDDSRKFAKFIHRAWESGKPETVQDFVADDIIPQPDGSFETRYFDWGGVYGPYQIAKFNSEAREGVARVYFTMSTWNPYQVVLMSVDIPSLLTMSFLDTPEA